jgi:hypothetical protein
MEKPVWSRDSTQGRAVVGIVVFFGLALVMYEFVPDAKLYFLALLDHTVTLFAGCGATVMLGILQKYVFKKPLSVKWELAILAAFVFFAGFQAWRDQYKENEASREPGTFVFQSLSQTRYKPSDNLNGNVQLWLNFANLQSKLITYNIDSLSLKSGSFDSATAKFANKGGYVYPTSVASYAIGLIPEPDVSAQVGGTLEYKVSYHLVGSKAVHHTEKSVHFDCFKEQPACRYLVLSEHED